MKSNDSSQNKEDLDVGSNKNKNIYLLLKYIIFLNR